MMMIEKSELEQVLETYPINSLMDLKPITGGLVLLCGHPGILSLTIPFATWGLLQGENILLLDGANYFDPSLVVQVAQRLNRPPEELLARIFVSRAFTCHQMEALITERLEEAMEKFRSRIVILSGFLNTFYDEDVPVLEALRLLKKGLRKLRVLAERYLILAVCPDPPVRVIQRKAFLNLLKNQARRVIEARSQGDSLALHERRKEA